MSQLRIRTIDEFNYIGKKVLLRVDINSPIDPVTKKIVNSNRIRASIPTIKDLLEKGACLAIIAHQGDTLDYQNLIPLQEHALILSRYLNVEVKYIDDVAGPAAQDAVRQLKPGELIVLGNLRYLTEEVSTFENVVKLEQEEMLQTLLVRNLAPLVDCYVNDAFAAAHRNAPSNVAFQKIMPAAAGRQFINEVTTLTRVIENPVKPAVFLLGGAKISDAFGMMKQVLDNEIADKVLACGITGQVMLMAQGIKLGAISEQFIFDRCLDVFIEPARDYMLRFPDKLVIPLDVAWEKNDTRYESKVAELPVDGKIMDIGTATIREFIKSIHDAGTIFANGPAGVYENEHFAVGTEKLLSAIAKANGFSVIGGGDTVNAATKFINVRSVNYVCTGGGAMVRFLSGVKLPLIEAMQKAY